jgi:predicted ATPase
MITELKIRNFKSWVDTGELRFAPLTGIFGANSSGKSAILQFLLMMKQTVESADRNRVLNTGDENSYVNLGTFSDIIYRHIAPSALEYEFTWRPVGLKPAITGGIGKAPRVTDLDELRFEAKIDYLSQGHLLVRQFIYSFERNKRNYQFGVRLNDLDDEVYELIQAGYKMLGSDQVKLGSPVKSYGFPSGTWLYSDGQLQADLALLFERLFEYVYYLGPLRQAPSATYAWSGERPQDVGRSGGSAVAALLAARARGLKVELAQGGPPVSLEERVAMWLRELRLIHNFRVAPIAENRNEYEVRVRVTSNAAEVRLTDVGFGVSQILPILVLCYYAPQGSIILLEQPEVHLHPAVQAQLADVFIDAISTRGVQIVVESHSEHLLRRLQRRIAEERLSPQKTALYFTNLKNGESTIEELRVDPYGNIVNWPQHFFGDEMGDLVAMTEAAMSRQGQGGDNESHR